ncbi:hypothetical protein GYMLUDRAFT_82108 [Collybiopsis luxurians FD-317 M1]|nr:hypothetical protein GYMLUDRAFT_82108 [Collybiopsis luxurians FD-317 M1]
MPPDIRSTPKLNPGILHSSYDVKSPYEYSSLDLDDTSLLTFTDPDTVIRRNEFSWEGNFDQQSSTAFDLLSSAGTGSASGYDPSEYDIPNGHSVNYEGYPVFPLGFDGDYDAQTSPASSILSDFPQQPHSSPNLLPQHITHSPRVAAAQSFQGMSFHSPPWGTGSPPESSSESAQFTASVQFQFPSPQRFTAARPKKVPRLLILDDEVPPISAPERGDGSSGPSLRIVPSSPVYGVRVDGDTGMGVYRRRIGAKKSKK